MGAVEGVEGPFGARRQELGAASARSLLLTVLGEFVLPGGRPVWTSALIALLADLDVAEKAARRAIMRPADSGWIEPSRIGRETRWALTAAGTELLRDGSGRTYGFAAGGQPRGGGGLGVLGAGGLVGEGGARVVTGAGPENSRALRQQLRSRLGWARLGSASARFSVT